MSEQGLSLVLSPASDDPPWQSPEYQRELRDFAEAVRKHGLEVSPRVRVQDAIDGGMWLVGEFAVNLAQTSVPTAIAAAVGAWLHARCGRKARLKIGDVEAEAQSVEEVAQLLKLAEKSREDDESGDGR